MRHLFFAACFFEAGLLLIILPWTVLWDRNYLLSALPWIHELAQSPYVRGAVSGLGLVNVGIGVAEIAALVAEHAFDALKAPIKRVATADVPIPFSPVLEGAVEPTLARIVAAVREVVDVPSRAATRP